MLLFDVTKTSVLGHHSGLMRTSVCLQNELKALCGGDVVPVSWNARRSAFVGIATSRTVTAGTGDWLITPELFSEEERPGFGAWLDTTRCRTAAIYHDAIPLRFPEFTWPRSVSRHPHYMKMLGRFDVVLANSTASADELRDYWRWLGMAHANPVAIPFGADGHGSPRVTGDPGRAGLRVIMMLGILEPRKNQAAVLDAAERLWEERVGLTLKIAGRVNPHFGRPLVRRIRDLRRAGRTLEYEERLDDAGVARLLSGARFTVMPSLAEGCGLPVLESLWAGVPVLCSDLPAINETASGGGCLIIRADDGDALTEAMRELLADGDAVTRMTGEAVSRALPAWADTAREMLAALV